MQSTIHYCPSCGTECAIVAKNAPITLNVLGVREITINADSAHCTKCDGEVWDHDLDEAILSAIYAQFEKETGYSVREYKKKFLDAR